MFGPNSVDLLVLSILQLSQLINIPEVCALQSLIMYSMLMPAAVKILLEGCTVWIVRE
jgi:hypothetical protein